MNRRKKLGAVMILSLLLSLIFPAGVVLAQWSPQVPSQPLPQQYPPQQTYPPPGQQQPYPPSGQMPQPPSQFPQGMSGQAVNDVFGRFSLSMPQGSMPMSSTYAFGVPQAMVQVNIMAVTQDQMFQMNLQNFPNMMRQMGGNIDAEKPIEVGGRQGRFFGVTLKNPQANASFHAMNVFIPGPNIWIQVMGPEQNTQQIGQVLQSILGGLRF
jgi:hypothetical protein